MFFSEKKGRAYLFALISDCAGPKRSKRAQIYSHALIEFPESASSR